MDKKPAPPELSQAEPLPTQEEQAQQVPASPPSRKRQIDSDDDDDDAEPRTKRARTTPPTSKPAPLTRKNLALFNKMVQGKGKDSDPTSISGSTKTTTATTTTGFADKAYKNGILEPVHSKPPTNLDDLRKRFAASRTTASPPESVYEVYVNRVEGAANEATVVVETSGKLLKEYDDKGYSRAFSRTFTNAPLNAGYNNGLSAPQPDFIEGLDKPEFRPFPVAEHIPGATLYKDDPRSITLPQIAGEWKGPTGDMRGARVQSAYDGAALVYARNQALAYMGESDPPGHAAITTFTTDGTSLNLYAHYAAPPEEGQETPEYHQYLVSSMSLTSTHQGHKDARRSLRNAQDFAKAQSEELRDQLKEHWRQQHKRDLRPPVAEEVPPLPAPGFEPLDAFEAHELDGYEIVQQPCQPTPEASTGPQKAGARSPSSSSKPKSHSTASSHSHSSKGKRKAASSSQSSHGSSVHVSKHRSYWKKDPATGGYYHKHADGAVSWLDDEEENECD